MLLIEFSPPFQWKPSLKKHGPIRRFMWGWLAVAHTPHDFNEFMEGVARAGVVLHRQGHPDLQAKPFEDAR